MLNLQPVPFDPEYIDPVFGITMAILAWVALFIVVFYQRVIDKVNLWAFKRRERRRERNYRKMELPVPDLPSFTPKASKWE